MPVRVLVTTTNGLQASWEENDTFKETLRLSEGRPDFTFYDGPPFATGLPHYGHILAGNKRKRRGGNRPNGQQYCEKESIYIVSSSGMNRKALHSIVQNNVETFRFWSSVCPTPFVSSRTLFYYFLSPPAVCVYPVVLYLFIFLPRHDQGCSHALRAPVGSLRFPKGGVGLPRSAGRVRDRPDSRDQAP